MEMSSERVVPATPEAVWKALNNLEVLSRCITGCEQLEEFEPNKYDVAMAVKVGPVNAKFKGQLSLIDIIEPTTYTINFEGKGGVAGFAKGSAIVRLASLPDENQTLLSYDASAKVGGKLAQLGSRLIDSAAKKMADDFFTKFTASFSETADTASAQNS